MAPINIIVLKLPRAFLPSFKLVILYRFYVTTFWHQDNQNSKILQIPRKSCYMVTNVYYSVSHMECYYFKPLPWLALYITNICPFVFWKNVQTQLWILSKFSNRMGGIKKKISTKNFFSLFYSIFQNKHDFHLVRWRGQLMSA